MSGGHRLEPTGSGARWAPFRTDRAGRRDPAGETRQARPSTIEGNAAWADLGASVVPFIDVGILSAYKKEPAVKVVQIRDF